MLMSMQLDRGEMKQRLTFGVEATVSPQSQSGHKHSDGPGSLPQECVGTFVHECGSACVYVVAQGGHREQG